MYILSILCLQFDIYKYRFIPFNKGKIYILLMFNQIRVDIFLSLSYCICRTKDEHLIVRHRCRGARADVKAREYPQLSPLVQWRDWESSPQDPLTWLPTTDGNQWSGDRLEQDVQSAEVLGLSADDCTVGVSAQTDMTPRSKRTAPACWECVCWQQTKFAKAHNVMGYPRGYDLGLWNMPSQKSIQRPLREAGFSLRSRRTDESSDFRQDEREQQNYLTQDCYE